MFLLDRKRVGRKLYTDPKKRDKKKRKKPRKYIRSTMNGDLLVTKQHIRHGLP